eukprot:1360437-Amphidinium_carterae.1
MAQNSRPELHQHPPLMDAGDSSSSSSLLTNVAHWKGGSRGASICASNVPLLGCSMKFSFASINISLPSRGD